MKMKEILFDKLGKSNNNKKRHYEIIRDVVFFKVWN